VSKLTLFDYNFQYDTLTYSKRLVTKDIHIAMPLFWWTQWTQRASERFRR